MLKIDLLPRHFAVARTNKIVLTGMIVLLVLVLLGWGAVIMDTKAKIAEANRKFEEVKPIADEVRKTEAETQAKQAQLAPIAQKVEFVDLANKSGEQYWDRFHAIKEYIYEKAQVTSLSITNPDGFNMNVIVGDTTECARFVLNLIRCPAITGLAISGLPAGVSIEAAGGGVVSFSPGADMGAGDAAAEAGMEGSGGPAPAAVAAPGEISLAITARLVEPVSEPMPPGGGGAPAPAGGMDPGMEAGAPPDAGGGGGDGGGGGGGADE